MESNVVSEKFTGYCRSCYLMLHEKDTICPRCGGSALNPLAETPVHNTGAIMEEAVKVTEPALIPAVTGIPESFDEVDHVEVDG